MVSLAAPVGAMGPPPTPKRPTLALKRDSSYMDTDDEASLSSSTKKLRVAFDPNVDVRIMEDWSEKSFDLVKEEVILAIDRHIAPAHQRDDAQYVKLLDALSQDMDSSEALGPKLLKKYLLAIDSRVSSLGECGKLVVAVLELSWLGRDDSFVMLFTKFLCDLVSAHGKFVPVLFERLVPHFAKLPASLGRLPDESTVSRRKMFTRLHLVIKALLRQVPSASSTLMRALRRDFPNDIAATKLYLQYQKHLLRLSDEIPELKSEILALIVQRLVSIDVQIQRDSDDLEDDAEESLLRPTERKSAHDVESDSDDSDVDSVSESELTVTEEEERQRELALKVANMDGTLDLLFEYYTPRIENGSAPESNEAYQQLLSHFTTFVLPNRTRHAQFLVFHFSQVSSAHIDFFANHCLESSMKAVGTSTHRFTACAYLSSFIARGAHIPKRSVQRIFETLCHCLEDMRQRYAPTCRGPDRRGYALYYAVAQAVVYIFCFRWRDLVIAAASPDPDSGDLSEDDILAEDGELVFIPGIKEIMHNNIYSRLNPLKVCSQEIVGEFAKIASHLRFLFVIPLLETNKRVRLGQTVSYYGSGGVMDIGRRETAWDRKAGDAHHHLEGYFPFDPYHLPQSKHWVANDYISWRLPRGMEQDEEEDDDDDDSGSEDEDDDDNESGEESVSGEFDHIPAASVIPTA